MENHVSATELVRSLGDMLNRVRYRGEVFVVERNGKPIARIAPLPEKTGAALRTALEAWRSIGAPDSAFADDLERVDASDRIPEDAWRASPESS